jgi:hypothetical protein
MRLVHAALICIAMAAPQIASAGELKGPGRFCGYAPIIDLAEGESIVTLDGGIHSGSFEWHGAFGVLNVTGIGWAGRPAGRMLDRQTARGHAIFRQRKHDGKYVVAIWNRANGVAYFESLAKITPSQLKAIDRVDLFDETQATPTDCRLHTIFVSE